MVIGRQFPGLRGSPSFGIGVISPRAHASGIINVLRDSFIMWANSTDNILKASLSRRELRLFIPDDLHTSISFIYFSTTLSGTNLSEKFPNEIGLFSTPVDLSLSGKAFAKFSPFVAK